MMPATLWTKAQAFNVVDPAATSPETIADATTSIAGLSEAHLVQHLGCLKFQGNVKNITSAALIVDASDGVPIGPQVANVACLFLPSFVPNDVPVRALRPYRKVHADCKRWLYERRAWCPYRHAFSSNGNEHHESCQELRASFGPSRDV
ncbi:hypothetical protein HPB50_025334 [Hyalomma asiaticum]|uniref:Uncharacterized protein n=1 Tax=Hyalomma asiaticum TaxID=266040 RepID=A0ACB7SR02_HYAAI|nr:hypothetical protein HPB50_025334 [Hyalomma asiaticum]